MTALEVNNSATALGKYSWVTIGADGHGLITYADDAKDLKAAHCADQVCSKGALTTVMALDGPSSSVVSGVDGLPLAASFGVTGSVPTIVAIHCSNERCEPNVRDR